LAKTTISKWDGSEAVTTSTDQREGIKYQHQLFSTVLNIDTIDRGLKNANGSYPKTYFYFVSEGESSYTQVIDTCDYTEFEDRDSHYSKTEVWAIGNETVRMYAECFYSEDSMRWFVAGTPVSLEEQSYVHQLFKKSTKPISIKRNDDQWLEASASGYVKTWSNRLTDLSKVADEGNSGAMFIIGYGYFHLDKNNAKASDWFLKSARAGHVNGQEWIGNMYLHGIGVEKDETKAIYWLKKAMAQGSSFAKKELEKLNG
jgi:hypothetical protein